MRLKLRIARVDTLGREREQKILVQFQTPCFEHRQQHFVSRAGISRRFEDDQMPATQALRDLLCGSEDVRDVGLLGFAQRRRHANDDRVTLAEMTKVRGGAQSLCVDNFFYLARRYVADVRSSGVNLISLCFVDFKASAVKTVGSKLDEQRQSDVPEPDDPNVCLFV